MVQIEKIKSKVLEIGKISPLINFSGSKTQNALEICNFSGTELYKYLKENGSVVLDCLESVQKDSLKVKANRTEYSKVLEKIYAKYKEITNEQGVNSLYIVIGFVKWVDSDESDLYSPLVLVPVTMERNLKLHSRGNYEYSLHLSEEEMVAILNHHAGVGQANQNYDLSAIANKYPLQPLLHMADYLSTFILERI